MHKVLIELRGLGKMFQGALLLVHVSAFSGTASAQTVSLYCQWPNDVASIVVDIDYTQAIVTMQFVASDHFPTMLQEDGENLRGLFLELDSNAMFAKLTGAQVEFIAAKTQRIRREGRVFHSVV